MMRVHFLNVGHGDCTVIAHPSGRLTMIDCNTSAEYDSKSFGEIMGELHEQRSAQNPIATAMSGFGGNNPFALAGNNPLAAPPSFAPAPGPAAGILTDYFEAVEKAKAELTDPVKFMIENYPGRRLWRFILTHPDLDHMRGLKRLYDTIGFDNFWDTAHTKPTPDFRTDADREDWEFYQQLRFGALGARVLRYHRGDRLFAFGLEENGQPGGDSIEILSPTPALIAASNAAGKSNDLSYVLRVRWNGTSVLLPGDAEEAAWDDMVAFYGADLKSDVLKASHHGRDSGFHLAAVQNIAPRVTVVSVGRKPETTDAHGKYYYHCGNVKSTRRKGNILFEVDSGGQQRWLVDRNADAG